MKAIDAALPACEEFSDAEIEVYDSGRYIAMSGRHIEGAPTEMREAQAFIDELADVETTDEIQDVFDVLIGHGNKEQYQQYGEWCEDHGLKAKVLPSVHRDCETFRGEHGDAIQDTVREWYRHGATDKDIHKDAEYEFGEPLPCDVPAGRRSLLLQGEMAVRRRRVLRPDRELPARTRQQRREGTDYRVRRVPGDAFETTLDHGLPGFVSRYLKSKSVLPFDDHEPERESVQASRPTATLSHLSPPIRFLPVRATATPAATSGTGGNARRFPARASVSTIAITAVFTYSNRQTSGIRVQ